MGKLLRAVVVGALIGGLLGFIDTYGYAITGYTTSELSGIIASILFLIAYKSIFRRTPSILEHVLGVIISVGVSLSTAITSGMYVTYTMLAQVGDPAQLKLPEWTYFSGPSLGIDTVSFYLYATAVSASGALVAYVFYRHFIDKEKLPFPIGSAIAVMIQVGKVLRTRSIVIPVALGIGLEFAAISLGNPSIDPTPALQSVIPGSSIAISLDLFIILLALLLPLNTSVGVGIGNVATFMVIMPILVANGLLISLPTMSASDLAVAAAPYTASLIIGFLVVSSAVYVIYNRKALSATFRYLVISKFLLKYLILGIVAISSTIVPVSLLYGMPLSMVLVLPAYIGLHLFLALVTARVVGEAGTASQSTLPIATLTLFASGARTAIPYIFMDPYTGVPMPQFIAGSSLNIIKASRSLDVDPEVPVFWLIVAMLAGAPLTLIYGHVLLAVFGINSPKLNLLRWVPIVTWMDAIFRGDIGSFSSFAIVLGLVFGVMIFFLLKLFRLGGISLYAILIGMTLTPDVGLLFLIAAMIKYVAYRVGTDVYEGLIAYTSLMLAGAGIGVGLSVLASALGVL